MKRKILDTKKALAEVDWAALDAKTDEDIRRAIAEDPDAAPEFKPGEMERLIREGKARIVRPIKKPT